MGKVTIAQIQDEGFRAEQFGTPADFLTGDTGYLARLIADASAWVQRTIAPATYAGAPSGSTLEFVLQRAELCYCSAALWRRRAVFLDGNAVSALEGGAAAERKQYLDQADKAWACALDWLSSAAAGGSTDVPAGTGAVLGSVETGPYAGADGALA